MRAVVSPELGHFLASCFLKEGGHAPKAKCPGESHCTSSTPVHQLTKVKLLSSSISFSHPALVDSGADANLMDYQLPERLERLNLPSLPHLSLSTPLLWMVDYNAVTHHTAPVTPTFTDSHSDVEKDFTFIRLHNNSAARLSAAPFSLLFHLLRLCS